MIELIIETNPNEKESKDSVETEPISEPKTIENQNNTFDLCVEDDEIIFTESSAQKLDEDIHLTENDIANFNCTGLTLSAGRYVFGEDIPLGKYNLKAISGKGMLVIQKSKHKDDEDFLWLGVGNGVSHSYYGLSLEQGLSFTLDGNLIIEISKSKMLEIN